LHADELSPFKLYRRLLSNVADAEAVFQRGNSATFKLPLNVTLPLRADKLSPFKFYQHLLTNVADAEAGKFLRMLTFLPLEEIAAIEAEAGGPDGAGAAQRRLAEEVTRFVHGKEGLQQALAATQVRTLWWCLPCWAEHSSAWTHRVPVPVWGFKNSGAAGRSPLLHGEEGLQQALAATQVRTLSVNSLAVQSTTPCCCLAPHLGGLDGRMQRH